MSVVASFFYSEIKY